MTWPLGDEEYRKAWREWLKRRNQWALAMVVCLGVLLFIAFDALWAAWRGEPGQHMARPLEVIGSALWGASFVAVAITGIRARYWKCPRCGNPFGQRYWWLRGGSMFACAHCGLRRDYVKSVADGKAHVDTSEY